MNIFTVIITVHDFEDRVRSTYVVSGRIQNHVKLLFYPYSIANFDGNFLFFPLHRISSTLFVHRAI